MNELEYDHNVFGENRFKADSKLYVRFYADAVEDTEASKKEGRRVFRDATFIHIQTPGDKRNIVIREARPADLERFQALYERYKQGEEDPVNGYPLKEWPVISKATYEELKYLGFRTVEQVAGASDSVSSKFAGLHALKARATTFLAAMANAAPVEQLQNALAERDAKLAAQQAAIDDMAKQLAALQADSKNAKKAA